MELYLMRHGIAVAKEDASEDFGRPLTDKGASRVRSAAKGIRRQGIEFDALISSPLVRARQTAEIVAGLMHQKGGVEELPSLAPDIPVEKLVADLARFENCDSVLLVGHEPLLSNAVAHLTTGKGALRIDLKKAGLCRIDIDTPLRPGTGTLRWLLAAKQLRLLGEGSVK